MTSYSLRYASVPLFNVEPYAQLIFLTGCIDWFVFLKINPQNNS
jgi:hypothetical protein